MTSGHFSGTRLHSLILIAATCVGVWVASFVFNDPMKPEDCKDVASVLASTAGTMAGFMLATLALVYSLSDKPITKYLDRRGILKRMLIDLLGSTGFWFVALVAALIASVPTTPYRQALCSLSFAMAIAALSLLPLVGFGFWCLLTNLSAPERPSSSANHPWDEPTNLD